MKDETKRKIIRLLGGTDRLMSKGNRNQGWNDTSVMYDEKKQKEAIGEELDGLSGEELDRELRRQILVTLPTALFFLALAVLVVWFLAVRPRA